MVIEKSKPGGGDRGYRLTWRRRPLAQAKTIAEIVDVIERQPRLITI